MPEPGFDACGRDEWDEHDWERFLRRADVRAAKYQELFETLLNHPERDTLIAHEMGWEHVMQRCGVKRDCPTCEDRFDCEAYEMLRLMSEPSAFRNDPEAEELLACFEQVHDIPAYCCASRFAARFDELLRKRQELANHEDAAEAYLCAQMVAAQIAGGHGIGYDRDSLCGNIANCKRALRSLAVCRGALEQLDATKTLPADQVRSLLAESDQVSLSLNKWIENLRSRIWWR